MTALWAENPECLHDMSSSIRSSARSTLVARARAAGCRLRSHRRRSPASRNRCRAATLACGSPGGRRGRACSCGRCARLRGRRSRRTVPRSRNIRSTRSRSSPGEPDDAPRPVVDEPVAEGLDTEGLDTEARQVDVRQRPRGREPALLSQHVLDVGTGQETTDRSSVASTASRSRAGNRPRTMGSTLVRVKARRSRPRGSRRDRLPKARRLTSSIRAFLRSWCAWRAAWKERPPQAAGSGSLSPVRR